LLSLVRQLHVFRDWQRFGEWMWVEARRAPFHPLEGRTLLVVGLGAIGAAIARLANGLGMRVIAIRARPLAVPAWVHRGGGPEDLPGFLGEADVVVNVLPLTRATRSLFNQSAFEAMKPGALFVNIARGATVVTDDLVKALVEGRLAGAAVDTTDPEPLPRGHPLWKIPNLIITPHVAGWGVGDTERKWMVMRENLRRFAAGERMLCVVNPGRGY
ncbi:MAG TPA: D-2-hydroxyacid dehydrogenase, partial [Gemmatimonadales bacterium]|nr:D-2-hydroxyacid dehydrogenase [Gemmatimonadales bacterium]